MREHLVGKITVAETKNEDTNIREMHWDVHKKKAREKDQLSTKKKKFL